MGSSRFGFPCRGFPDGDFGFSPSCLVKPEDLGSPVRCKSFLQCNPIQVLLGPPPKPFRLKVLPLCALVFSGRSRLRSLRMSRPVPKRAKRAGFTLIELL